MSSADFLSLAKPVLSREEYAFLYRRLSRFDTASPDLLNGTGVNLLIEGDSLTIVSENARQPIVEIAKEQRRTWAVPQNNASSLVSTTHPLELPQALSQQQLGSDLIEVVQERSLMNLASVLGVQDSQSANAGGEESATARQEKVPPVEPQTQETDQDNSANQILSDALDPNQPLPSTQQSGAQITLPGTAP